MSRRVFLEEPRVVLPQPPDPPITPQGFVMLMVNALPGTTPELWAFQQWIYQQALAKAKAVVRPSIVERDLLGHWN